MIMTSRIRFLRPTGFVVGTQYHISGSRPDGMESTECAGVYPAL